MTSKTHKKNFERIYKKCYFGCDKILFPLEEIEAFDWNRGKFGNEYNSYFYRRFSCHIYSRLNIKNGHKILVIGCGAGSDEKNIKQIYPRTKIFSIDISEEMIKQAKTNNCTSVFLISLAEALPFKNDCFDRVLSREVIEHVIDPQMMLKEIFRILKPNRIAVITTENEESLSPVNFYNGIIRNKLAYLIGIELPRKTFKDKAPKLLEMKILIENAGLQLIETFWDGALYKSLLSVLRKVNKIVKPNVASIAHWVSCLENNRKIAFKFCDQAKYVIKKPNTCDVEKIDYKCIECGGVLKLLSRNKCICRNCNKKYNCDQTFPLFYTDDYFAKSSKNEHEKMRFRKILFKTMDSIFKIAYFGFYLSFAIICTLLVKKNKSRLSHVLHVNDKFNDYLKN